MVTEKVPGAEGRELAEGQPMVPTQQVKLRSPGPPGSSDLEGGEALL